MEPVLTWPTPVPTEKQASKGSSASPERWETIAVMPHSWASWIVPRVSVIVPIWLALTRTELAASFAAPIRTRAGFVANRSSPTI